MHSTQRGLKYTFMIKVLILSATIVGCQAIEKSSVKITNGAEVSSGFKFLMANAYYPQSFDPLDGDNISAMLSLRMRYLTPIEIDHNDTFKSTILSSFEYDPKLKEMLWKPKANLKYSDGKPITPQDVVLAVKRMLLARPDFPTIEHIVGKVEWLRSEYPLTRDLAGLTLEKNGTIKIRFGREIANPYFRFSTELFSILPSDCFDLKTSKLTCKNPPASGYYDFVRMPNLEKPSEDVAKRAPLDFKLRPNFETVFLHKMPKNISFVFTGESLDSTIEKVDDSTIIYGMDTRISDEFLNKYRDKVVIKRLPKTSVWYLLLDPSNPLFITKECRRIFANEYRKVYGEKKKFIGIATKSFFSQMMPGYLSNEEIERISKTPSLESCDKTFTKAKPKIRRLLVDSPNYFWDKVYEAAMTNLKISTSGIYSGKGDIVDPVSSFLGKETPIMAWGMGFWAQDLPGDFKMFFDEKMHPEFKRLLKDGKLKNLVQKLQTESDSAAIGKIYKDMNMYLYDEAILNSLSHFGIVYVSKKSSLNKIPIATSQPNPWQLFFSMVE